MKNTLKNFGLKHTACRVDIINTLSKAHHPISAEAIHQKLKKQYDLVTIYRNLTTFEKKGIVFKEHINKINCYYLDNAQQQHHHIICNNCGKTECIPCTHHKLKIKNFIEVKHQLLLSGVCHNCATS